MAQPNKNSNNPEPPPRRRSEPVSLLKYTDIAFRMGVTIALGAWFGKWLDGKMGMTKPVFLLVFSLAAVGLAIYMVVRDVSKKDN